MVYTVDYIPYNGIHCEKTKVKTAKKWLNEVKTKRVKVNQ